MAVGIFNISGDGVAAGCVGSGDVAVRVVRRGCAGRTSALMGAAGTTGDCMGSR